MNTKATKMSDWKRLWRILTMMAALLLFAAVPGRAADYVLVFVNGNTTYYLARNGTTGVQRVTTFDPTTCIWSCASNTAGTTAGTLNNSNTYGYLFQMVTVNGTSTRYFLGAEDNDFSLATSVVNNNYRWRTNGTYVYNRFSNNTSYYINLANATPARNTNANTASNARPYQVTTTNINQSVTTTYDLTAPTIAPSSAGLYNGENETFSGSSTVTSTTTTIPAYTRYVFNENTFYYYNNTVYTSTTSFITETSSVPTGDGITYSWALSSTANASVNASGVVSVNSAPATDQTVTLTCTARHTASGTTETNTVTLTIYAETAAPEITLLGSDQAQIACATPGATIYYTTDGSTPSASSTVYSGAFDLTAQSTTIKAIAIRNGHASAVASETLTRTVEQPAISINGSGNVTIACATDGATIHYTTDGSTPTAGSATYSAPFNVANGTTVMAIAVKSGYDNSAVTSAIYVTSGVSGTTVILNDLEDHTWTYYAGVDASVDGGNYNTNYLGKLYSPNPRNVKIVYNGVNGITGSSITVKVSRTENETSFVYYKTLEQGSTSGEYPYQVISNPFSVRPSTGTGNSKVYYGFAGWKIVSGGEYIKNHNNNDVLALDEEIVFNNLPYPSVNCTSAEIVFQTTWTTANVQTGNNIATMLNSFNGGTYETNFAVLTGQYTTAWTGNKNATITSVYPDGSSDVRSTTNYTRPNVTVNDGYTIKYEYININNNNSTLSIGSGTKTLYIGRGVSNTTANGVVCNLIQGYDGTINSGGLTYTLKIESGIYNIISFIKGYNGSQQGNTVTGTVAVKGVLGCDYDRANNDNSKLKIQDHPIMGYANAQLLRSPAAGSEVLNVTIKSGSLNSNLTSAGTADVAQSFYIGIGGQYSPGARVLTVEGGEMWSIAAGICQNTATTNSIRFRIKGGLIKGSIYGSAANADSYGYKQMIITGGHIKGWIAGGGNGTSANGGTTTGSSYIYVGGNARVDSEGSNTNINSSLGGQVFGSGSGVPNTTTWGEMLYGSNVVIADNAYVERNVFGGGNFGWTDETATIYLTGENMSVGNVYGGANQNKGDYVNIYMTGGTVRDGLYGGSNTDGTVGYNVNMHINGGTVGNSESGDGIFGGGYGSETMVSGNVSITLGASTSAADSATVYGNVYGGSALGRTNNGNANNTTTVTMNKALVNGNLFGGAYGSGAAIVGLITVNVNGGRINGNVFGGGDAAPYNKSGQNYPVVNMTGGQATNVFGGGKGPTASVTGNPQVTLSGTAKVTGNVYGGGDAAPVTGQTNVILRD